MNILTLWLWLYPAIAEEEPRSEDNEMTRKGERGGQREAQWPKDCSELKRGRGSVTVVTFDDSHWRSHLMPRSGFSRRPRTAKRYATTDEQATLPLQPGFVHSTNRALKIAQCAAITRLIREYWSEMIGKKRMFVMKKPLRNALYFA